MGILSMLFPGSRPPAARPDAINVPIDCHHDPLIKALNPLMPQRRPNWPPINQQSIRYFVGRAPRKSQATGGVARLWPMSGSLAAGIARIIGDGTAQLASRGGG